MSVDLSELSFEDLEPRKLVFPIGKSFYMLREPTEADVCRWRNAQIKEAKMVNGKVTGIGNVANTEPLLVSMCLYAIANQETVSRDETTGEYSYAGPEDGKGLTQMPLQVVQAWPGRIVSKLFEKVKELGDLNEKDTPERKAVLAAFAREDSPASLPELRSWIEQLVAADESTYQPLQALVAPSAEEAAKNGVYATPAT